MTASAVDDADGAGEMVPVTDDAPQAGVTTTSPATLHHAQVRVRLTNTNWDSSVWSSNQLDFQHLGLMLESILSRSETGTVWRMTGVISTRR